MIRHGQRNRGDGHLERHSFILNAAQFLIEVESSMQSDGCPSLSSRQQVEQAKDVRRRRRHLETVGGTQPERQAPVFGRQGNGVVGMTNRLRPVRRPRTEDQNRLVPIVRFDLGWRLIAGAVEGWAGSDPLVVEV